MWKDIPRSTLYFGAGCFGILSTSYVKNPSFGWVFHQWAESGHRLRSIVRACNSNLNQLYIFRLHSLTDTNLLVVVAEH